MRAAGLLGRPWRWLRRMSTALHLLLAVAACCVIAALLPQEGTAAATVAHWRAGTAGPGEATTALLDAVGLLDVLGSWWFLTLSGLLVASLVSCLVPRTRALGRALRRPPPAGRQLDALGHRTAARTDLAPDEALSVAAAALRRRRFRVRALAADAAPGGRPQVAAERGRSREVGSVAFHLSILLLLGAIAIGQAYGFTGQVDLVEGETFTETRVAYDRAAAGPGWDLGDHRGFTVALESFRTSDHPDGTPREFVADVSVDAAPAVPVEINHPVRHQGMRIHLARHGLAVPVSVVDAESGELVAEEPVRFAAAGPLAWAGLLVLDPGGQGRDQAVLDLVLLPEAQLGPDGHPVAVGTGGDPVLLVDAYQGPAVLRELDGRREVDRAQEGLGATEALVADEQARVGDGRWEVRFGEPRPWAGFQVSRVPGTRALLAAGLLLLLGLTLSLHAFPMRLWVEARPTPAGTDVVLAGVARHRLDAFDEAFERHAGAVLAALDRAAHASRRPEPGGAAVCLLGSRGNVAS